LEDNPTYPSFGPNGESPGRILYCEVRREQLTLARLTYVLPRESMLDTATMIKSGSNHYFPSVMAFHILHSPTLTSM
jgi:hypothetical protein